MIPQQITDALNAVQADQDQLAKSRATADTADAALKVAQDAKVAADAAVAADTAHRDTDLKSLHAMLDQVYGATP